MKGCIICFFSFISLADNSFGGIDDCRNLIDKVGLTPELLEQVEWKSRSARDYRVAERYRVHIRGSSLVRDLKFVDVERNDFGVNILVFSGKKGRIHKFPEAEAFVFKPRKEKNVADRQKFNILDYIGTGLILTMGAARSTLPALRRIKSGKNFNIYAGIGKNDRTFQTATKFKKNLEEFDGIYEQLGWNLPKNTRLYISDDPLFLNIVGPHTVPIPIFNLFAGGGVTDIRMEPNSRDQWGPSTNTGVLIHERGHNLLHQNFSRSALVNIDLDIQEAMSDFFSADFTNNPALGLDELQRGQVGRDIANRAFGNGRGAFHVTNATQIGINGYHNDSVVYSNLLWEMRKKVGSPAMRELLRPFMQALNQNWTDFSKARFKKVSSAMERFEYFIANLRQVAKQQGFETESNAVVAHTIESLGLNASRIARIQSKLSSDNRDWSYRPINDAGPTNFIIYSLVAGFPVALAFQALTADDEEQKPEQPLEEKLPIGAPPVELDNLPNP